jgi:hypothetical protein
VPKEISNKVPPKGVRKMGVRNAMPTFPYLPQIETILLFFDENFGLGLFLLSAKIFLNLIPMKLNTVTLDIMPATVTRIVSIILYPAAEASTGPAINLNQQRK